jgi:hypothetical protein
MWVVACATAVGPHPWIVVLARQVDLEAITDALRPYYHRLGRYAKAIHLVVRLHLLKLRWDLSSARVVGGALAS